MAASDAISAAVELWAPILLYSDACFLRYSVSMLGMIQDAPHSSTPEVTPAAAWLLGALQGRIRRIEQLYHSGAAIRARGGARRAAKRASTSEAKIRSICAHFNRSEERRVEKVCRLGR